MKLFASLSDGYESEHTTGTFVAGRDMLETEESNTKGAVRMFDETVTEDVTQIETSSEFTTDGDVLDTPSLKLPEKQPEIHEGTVVSVTTKVGSTSGNSYGVITLQSKSNGLSFEFGFFPPQAWFEPTNWGARGFDPSTLSDVPAPGKKQTPQDAFARTVSNTDSAYTKQGVVITELVPGKDATLQQLKKMAAIEGFTLDGTVTRPTNGTEYIEVINSLVAGRLDVLFTLRPQKDDNNPQFDGKLKVNQILPKSDLEKPNFEKRFANYRKAWEQ